MKCKKHSRYQAKGYPTPECAKCLDIWNQKKEEKRLDPPCDARAYAERYDFGNYDPERFQLMANEELFKAICNEACSCDMMIGWTCNFCRELKFKLEKALRKELKHAD